MTRLSARTTRLAFETSDDVRAQGKYRPVVIEATPYIAMVKLKGTKTAYPISYAAIYECAAKLEARRVLAEKKAGGKQCK